MLPSSAMADIAELAGLPSRVDALERNLTEFRVEVRQEFALVHTELKAEIRSAVKDSEHETQRQMFMLHEDLVQRIQNSEEETRRQVRDLNDETRRHMSVLHEDLVQRITTIGEG